MTSRKARFVKDNLAAQGMDLVRLFVRSVGSVSFLGVVLRVVVCVRVSRFGFGRFAFSFLCFVRLRRRFVLSMARGVILNVM